MKLAILGGSFNPVHKGHLFLAKQAADEYGYERVLFIPAREPPHKTLASGASDTDRLEMLKRALNEYGDNRFFIDDCELKRSGPSYTIDTVYDLEARYAGALEGKIGLIIGSDLAADFGKWKNADLLAEKADIVLGCRPLRDDEKLPEGGFSVAEAGVPDKPHRAGEHSGAGGTFPRPHLQLHNEFCAVSSAAIRRMTAEKKDWKALVPASVYEYIVQRKLYGFK
ncbi:nicotinate (nicotinamide) nucleotide adenylyltransferase [Treponema sp. OMZ 840]|uniref:nicotinate (nicotinamide) nucleotide adenylyltransferase n=1 Tax=Treponema sp. OMZ 840 TaxID=244313 RepID=UPI003D91D94A